MQDAKPVKTEPKAKAKSEAEQRAQIPRRGPTLTKAEREAIDSAEFYGPKLSRAKDMSDAEWRRMQVSRDNVAYFIGIIKRLTGEKI